MENVPYRSLQGIVPALVTPFRADERIDYDAWQVIIDTLIASGVDGLFAAGTHGEFFALDMEERSVALRFCQQAIAGRVASYGNVGSITTRDSIKLAQSAEAEGINYLVVITPYYIRPSADELAEHYIEICRAVRTPVLAYNIPAISGVDLTPEIVARVAAQCENFAGVKDSSGNLEYVAAYAKAAPGRPFKVFAGRDDVILPALEQGCVGAVTAYGNVAPKLYVDLFRAFRAGDLREAARLQALVRELSMTFELHTFPAVVKEAMQMAGLPAGPCRKPVGPMPAEARAKVAAVLAKLGEQNYLPRPANSVTA